MARLRILLLAATLAAMAGVPAMAEYPERTVRVIVPVAAGGGVDVMARMLAQKLGERLGRQFIVENRPGAAGIIGTRALIAAPADGYSLLYTPSSLSLTVAINKTAPYDLVKDLTPIINVAISPYVLVVHPSVPAHDLKEFVAYAKANAGKLSFSSGGAGSASHLAAELFKSVAGIEATHIPNKGMNPAIIDLLGGQVQFMFAGVPGLMTERSGRLRPIAMAEMRRSALLPDLPTLDEQGLKGFEVANWAGLLAPAGLDAAIVQKLNSEVIAILGLPETKERLQTLGFDMLASTPQQFGAQLTKDLVRWRDAMLRAGIPQN
ncbi:MAG: tripartite tricarboxylate transporter substrate binding protein [Proteobacteria bacterium]|nr:tripartite tricarboxylate transporter substrate binding protein [Pseudomonadota bacterium]